MITIERAKRSAHGLPRRRGALQAAQERSASAIPAMTAQAGEDIH